MTIQTIADITPNGSAVPLAAAGQAVWILVTATGNSIRIGDANVGASRGVKIPAGVPTLIPRCAFTQGGYDLAAVHLYGAAGADSVSVTFGS